MVNYTCIIVLKLMSTCQAYQVMIVHNLFLTSPKIRGKKNKLSNISTQMIISTENQHDQLTASQLMEPVFSQLICGKGLPVPQQNHATQDNRLLTQDEQSLHKPQIKATLYFKHLTKKNKRCNSARDSIFSSYTKQSYPRQAVT